MRYIDYFHYVARPTYQSFIPSPHWYENVTKTTSSFAIIMMNPIATFSFLLKTIWMYCTSVLMQRCSPFSPTFIYQHERTMTTARRHILLVLFATKHIDSSVSILLQVFIIFHSLFCYSVDRNLQLGEWANNLKLFQLRGRILRRSIIIVIIILLMKQQQ